MHKVLFSPSFFLSFLPLSPSFIICALTSVHPRTRSTLTCLQTICSQDNTAVRIQPIIATTDTPSSRFHTTIIQPKQLPIATRQAKQHQQHGQLYRERVWIFHVGHPQCHRKGVSAIVPTQFCNGSSVRARKIQVYSC